LEKVACVSAQAGVIGKGEDRWWAKMLTAYAKFAFKILTVTFKKFSADIP
jgi:hypothetical protein